MRRERNMATYYVKNNHTASIQARAIVKDGDTEKEVSKVFPMFRQDRQTGQLISNGYTSIDSDTYDILLEKSAVFKAYIKDGKLVKYDEAPEDALTEAQRVAKLTTDLTSANVTVSALTAQVATLTVEVADLTTELEAAKAQVTTITAEKATLESELAILKSKTE
jgi:hypothetical protein